MAGRGPLPDPNHRHRNISVIPTTSLPAKGRQGRSPKCPYELGAAGKEWWSWAWHTPQAACWSVGDLYFVARRARMEDREEMGPTVEREMRECDDRLGLTPKGMAALRWSIIPESIPAGMDSSDASSDVSSLAARREALTRSA